MGTQTIKTQKFVVEIFDCEKYLTFLGQQHHQLEDADDKIIPVVAENTRPDACAVASYEATGLVDGITLDKESGDFTVVTKNAIEKTEVQVAVVVGSQSLSTPK